MKQVSIKNIRTQEEREWLVKQMSVLSKSAGWGVLREVLEGLKGECEEDLFALRDGDSELVYSRLDLLRRERRYIEALLSYPEVLLRSLTEKQGVDLEEFDPYL